MVRPRAAADVASDAAKPVPIRPATAVAGGDEPPHTPGMEALIARVDGLERRVEKIDSRLDGIDVRLRGVEVTLANISGKIDLLTGSVVGKLPSWWQMPAVVAASVALISGLLALAKYFHAIG